MVTSEILALILRGGKDHYVMGDPYDFAVTVLFVEPSRAILKALVMQDKARFTITHWKQIREVLKDFGVVQVDYERKTKNSRGVTVYAK